jgi:hypothetical protein
MGYAASNCLNLVWRLIRMRPLDWGKRLGDKLRYKPCSLNEGYSFMYSMPLRILYNDLFPGAVPMWQIPVSQDIIMANISIQPD